MALESLCMCVLARPAQVERMDLVGSVAGCDVIIVDDMIDTAGTLCAAADSLKANGANRVYAFASHGLFSGPASDRIKRSTLEEVVVVNTVPLRSNAKTNDKIKMVRDASACTSPSLPARLCVWVLNLISSCVRLRDEGAKSRQTRLCLMDWFLR